MSLYAVRLGKWIEIREATRKPKAIVTKVKHHVETLKRTRTREGFIAYVPQQKPLIITQVVHEGGKVVKVLSYLRFNLHSTVRVVDHGVTLIPQRDPFHTYFRQYLGGTGG